MLLFSSKKTMKLVEVTSLLSQLRLPTSLVFTPTNLEVEKKKFFESDMIKTGQNASAGLIFSDDTLVSVGQNAEFTIKEYMFKPGDKKGSFVGKIGKGTIACMTGLIAKMNPESMKVESRTATIGIRGTYFVVEAE